jgi:hypothetical protein
MPILRARLFLEERNMVREPMLTTVPIADLRPTQLTVGMREVEAKRKRWREIAAKEGGKFLGKHMIPTVLGPKARHYVVDHHHLARALHNAGVNDVAVTLIANLSKLEQDEFWTVMDNRSWMHPFDSKGQRRHYEDIPKRMAGLVDDPFRSLAGSCGAPVALPRTPRHSANFSGPISCAGA